ncbi:hypothetical protein PHLCEN_2v8621 [Hermanssonia centrifuga]|uniref:Uncharacterized protein n=1 Tax=Hermanssonia centrifuga TaxID=98765 RepID=A0A2R6NT67_9APHY|nr:hypothetical protein PHLCEN_2v8621 [Hermanssonia centrifuga]
MHAPELLGSYPFIPVVAGDDDLPAHPLLGFDLSLPSLLRIPTLRVLRMRETHMGDQRWCNTPALCKLDVLEVGSSCYESPDSNRVFAERILQNIGNSVKELSLSSSLASALSPVGGALPSLRQLRITKLFPLEYLAETLSALSHSPIELLSIECHEDDIEDMCYALEDFLNLCAEHRREPIYCHLKHISLQPVAETSNVSSSASKLNTAVADSLSGDAAMAIQRVQQYLQDIRFSRK